MTDHLSSSQTATQDLLNKIVIEHFKDKKRKRIWHWIRMSLALIATIAIALSFSDLHLDDAASKLKPHVGIIDLKGEIFDGQLAS